MRIINFDPSHCFPAKSLYLCDIDDCEEEVVVINKKIAKGRRCLKHAPKIWIEAAIENSYNS